MLLKTSANTVTLEPKQLGPNVRIGRPKEDHCAAWNTRSDETSRHKHRGSISNAIHHEHSTPRLEDMLFEASCPDVCATIAVSFVVDGSGKRQEAAWDRWRIEAAGKRALQQLV